MNIDFVELEKAVAILKDAVNIIVEGFRKAWERIRPILLNLCETLEEVDYEEKVKFEPILKIKPNKINFQNKRLVSYHCRNNC